MIVIGDADLTYVEIADDGQVIEYPGDGQNLTIEQTIDQPVYTFEAFNDYNSDPGNISVDNESVDLGGNIQVIEVFADGFIEIQQDFVQNIDQDIVQDVFYEVEIVQDFIQEQDINQTYTADVIQTETRTRLAD